MTSPTQSAPSLLSVEEALRRIGARIQPVAESETVPLEQARHRVLASNIVAGLDVPPWRNSAMDGYAVNAAALNRTEPPYELEVAGTALAGRPYRGAPGEHQCIRIMTGAPLPEGADAVVIQENVERRGDRIHFSTAVTERQNVREAGEDVRRDTTVLHSGRRLSAADLGVLASLGRASVEVYRPLRVAFFTSGDELRAPGEPLDYGELYNSNRYALAGLLQQAGVQAEFAGNLPDTPDTLRRVLAEAGERADTVITCGGVSVGEADYVADVVRELGEIEFGKVAVKPGKPLHFGRLGSAAFFGLPGNPVSAAVTFLIFVQPALDRQMGRCPLSPVPALPATLETDLRKRPGRAEYQRGTFSQAPSGGLSVRPAGSQGSHQLSALSAADCLIVLDAECGDLPAGESVRIMPLQGLL